MKLMIVESPSKTKKIAHYLGDGWRVEASFGHMRDLPNNAMGVAAPDYIPEYEIPECSQKQVSKLKALAKEAEVLYLASDPDREGEAIAWHLNEVLGKGKKVLRVTFNEITETAVKKAIEQPRMIDENLFEAQQARRVLDRLYGYKLSPALSDKLAMQGVSAGRVQSVALRLIVEREKSIRDFKITHHFGLQAAFPDFSATWDTADFIMEDEPYILERSAAQIVADAVTQEGLIVSDFSEKQAQRKAPSASMTSTLQQAAANILKMSVGDTMKAAQKLLKKV